MDLDGVRVAEAMQTQVLSCEAETPLEHVAALMLAEQVPCMIVEGAGGDAQGWALVSAVDLVANAGAAGGTAGKSASTKFWTVTPDEPLSQAARMLIEHDASHLIVIDPDWDQALGVLSTLDVVRALASPET
jgi:CBS domain-containing protein